MREVNSALPSANQPTPLKKTLLATLLPLLLTACGGGDGDTFSNIGNSSPTPPDTSLNTGTGTGTSNNTNEAPSNLPPGDFLIGQFIDSPVANLRYQAGEQSGSTDSEGQFRYQPGELITFFIGGLAMPTIPAQAVLTPLDWFDTSALDHPGVVNASRLLQSMDEDGNPDNGISIPETAHDIAAGTSIDFQDDAAFEQSAIIALTSSIPNISTLVDANRAKTHLANSFIANDISATMTIDASGNQAVLQNNAQLLDDTDGDGIANVFDHDDDEDGVTDALDRFPLNAKEAFDFDNDGIGNNADPDDDNDGIIDSIDAFDFVPSESRDFDADGFGDNLDTDDDNDGALDQFDAFPFDANEQIDTDNDGIGNNKDSDDDNDGVPDGEDAFPLISTESNDNDRDGLGDNIDPDDDNDGAPDQFDSHPIDQSEQSDTDNDGIGNNADDDDDGDGVPDIFDTFQLIAQESSDNDGDGIGDNLDPDDDNDGAPDQFDAFPLDPHEHTDTDNDGIGNNADTDDDNDGYVDSEDAFRLVATEHSDNDSDGMGDNLDPDDDNDGVRDQFDSHPLDPTEQVDTDGDGLGNNQDDDDDGDGTPDSEDDLPLNPNSRSDFDNDGIADELDDDLDNDGAPNSSDLFPLDPLEAVDSDYDGIGNNADEDDDNDGVPDVDDAFPLNPSEQFDSDGDGIGDNRDYDSDNDGTDDWLDDFPLDPLETIDTDRDGIGNNADDDDDNDGFTDDNDPEPLNRYIPEVDTDGDGENDRFDNDDDNDGVRDYYDAFPLDASETTDLDSDGIGDNADLDDDADGTEDTVDAAPRNSDCHLAADATDGECNSALIATADLFASDDNQIIYLANKDTNALLRVNMITGAILPGLVPNSFSTADTTLTAIAYSGNHGRLYLGYSSGAINYLDTTTNEAVYLYTLSDAVSALSPAGNHLLAQTGLYGSSTHTILDETGTLLDSSQWQDSTVHSAWNDTQGQLHYVDSPYMRSIEIDPLTGTIGLESSSQYNSSYTTAPPVLVSPDGNTVVNGSGELYDAETLDWTGSIDGDIADFSWTATDGLVAVRQIDDQAVLTRYTSDLRVTEEITYQGTIVRLFEDSGTYYLLTRDDGAITLHNFVPSDDSDNDLVLNEDDAFPLDAAASTDSDNDGYPDAWNSGYGESDSTTGLLLDAYPTDAACYLFADGNGTHCNYGDVIPTEQPNITVSDSTGIVYILYTEANLIYRWDITAGNYLEPIYVGTETPTATTSPTHMVISNSHNRLYLGYPKGKVTYVSLAATDSVDEIDFITLPATVGSLAVAGDYVRAANGSYSAGIHYYDADAVLTDSASYADNAYSFSWNSTNNRLYFMDNGNYTYDLQYEELSADGAISGKGDAPFVSALRLNRPVFTNPDGTLVLTGSGDYFNATDLVHMGAITRSVDQAVWIDNDQLAIIVATTTGGELAYYDSNLAPVSSEAYNDTPIGLFYHDGSLTLVTHSDTNGLQITNP